jgi:mannose-6-phosphate isomerase-like protein (cupin superfamily)
MPLSQTMPSCLRGLIARCGSFGGKRSALDKKPRNITLAEARRAVGPTTPFSEVFRDGSNVSIEYYEPSKVDLQTPHDRDELYIVVSGQGQFQIEGDEFTFSAGDLIYVPAFADHRFISFSNDFSVWVIFYGPIK